MVGFTVDVPSRNKKMMRVFPYRLSHDDSSRVGSLRTKDRFQPGKYLRDSMTPAFKTPGLQRGLRALMGTVLCRSLRPLRIVTRAPAAHISSRMGVSGIENFWKRFWSRLTGFRFLSSNRPANMVPNRHMNSEYLKILC